MHHFTLPSLGDSEYLYISPEGLNKLATVYDPKDPVKNINWTVDYTLELPIRMKKFGPGSEVPVTLVEKFIERVKASANKPALSVKRENQWKTLTFKQYFDDAKAFAQALMSLNITEQRSVNIIGFNAPEWLISFYGSIFGNYLPIGVYTTNGPDACHYLCEHSDCEVAVVENREQLKKYLQIWDRLPLLKVIVVYNDQKLPDDLIPSERKKQIYQWNTFLEIGRQFKATDETLSLEARMLKQKPGNCCTLVYTSGTTGQPKGVMLSHDSKIINYIIISQDYIYPAQTINKNRGYGDNERLVSYLPLSHVAAQMIDIISSMTSGFQVFFASPDALQGSLVETLKEIRPTFFFSVPRVWEKIEEKMKQMAQHNGYAKRSIANWAKGLGRQGTFAELHNQKPPICFSLAKSLVFNQVKIALGLDQVWKNFFNIIFKCKYLMFGAAPLSPVTRDYFLSLNIFLLNAYGMSECAGATTISDPVNFEKFDDDFLVSTGNTLDGTEILIYRPDKDGNGEICYRGRHIFMGYYKNEDATRQTIDEYKQQLILQSKRFLHSGDIGKLDKKGNLKITGRIKELIITAGGENVAPVLIENEIKEQLKFVSNCMVIGDQKKFLAVLFTFKHKMEKDGSASNELEDEVIEEFKEKGSKVKTVQEARNDEVVQKLIQQGLDKANQRAISKAQHVRKWAILDGDFTVAGGELTPTLKLKRKEVEKKHMALIEQIYIDPKL